MRTARSDHRAVPLRSAVPDIARASQRPVAARRRRLLLSVIVGAALVCVVSPAVASPLTSTAAANGSPQRQCRGRGRCPRARGDQLRVAGCARPL